MKINLANKGFQFFLAGSTQVASLEAGARSFGGATQFGSVVKSNVEAGDFVEVGANNTLKVFVPSTVNVDGSASADVVAKMLDRVRHTLDRIYLRSGEGSNLTITETKGSWYSEDQQKVVVEDIYIVSIDVQEVADIDVQILTDIASRIKRDMSQEGVSIMINQALAIV